MCTYIHILYTYWSKQKTYVKLDNEYQYNVPSGEWFLVVVPLFKKGWEGLLQIISTTILKT